MKDKVKGRAVFHSALITTGLPWWLMRFYTTRPIKAKGPILRPALRSIGQQSVPALTVWTLRIARIAATCKDKVL